MILKKSEDAVSPVIGVMLLLVVTIVIAAVVAVFASGVGTDAEPAPATVLDIVDICDTGDSGPEIWVPPEDPEKMEIFMNLPTDENERIVDAAGNHLFEEGEWGGDNMEKPTAVGKEYLHLAGGGIKPVTVTIKSISGDTLDLSKLSIKVYDSENMLVADKQQNSLSGTISPGDLKIIDLDEFIDENDWDYGYEIVDAGEKVEVFVLYGEHVIVSKELKVTGEH